MPAAVRGSAGRWRVGSRGDRSGLASDTLAAAMIVRASLVVAVLLWVSAREARACEPELCADVVAVLDVELASSAAVPTDGVLVLKADTIGAPGPGALGERVAVTVTRDGSPVEGTLTTGDFADLLIWRPAQPLVAGAMYMVTGSASNPGADGVCAEAEVPLAFSFTAAQGPVAALVPAELMVQETHFDEPVLTLTTLVCCDDAYPGDQTMCGMSYGATWIKGKCAATQTRGFLKLQLTGKPGVDASSAGQWARVLREEGEVVAGGVATTFLREVDAPTCFTIDQVSLATGEVAPGKEQCVGEAQRDRLGVRALDPAVELEGQCISDLYTCEIEDGRWDQTRCKSWGLDAMPEEMQPVPAEEKGCGCRGDAGGAGLAVGLLALLGRGRRRRGGSMGAGQGGRAATS